MNKQVANVQLMQKMNRLKVLNYVRSHPDCLRPEISRKTGLSLASITNITSYLLDIGILSENGTEVLGTVGRRSTRLRFKCDAYKLICVFISQKHITIYVTDLLGSPIDKLLLSTDSLSADEVISLACESAGKLAASFKKGEVLSIGVAVSALILENSKFIFSSDLRWESIDIKNLFEEATKHPVFVSNTSHIRAEWYFSIESPHAEGNMLFADLENGIGAVCHTGGTLNRNIIGEIGHTTVENDGEECFCGNKGCLEVMCSTKRLLTLYEELSGRRAESPELLEELYTRGDTSAISAVNECAKYLGIGFANLINLFNPSLFVINTGDFKSLPSLIKKGCEEMKKRSFASLSQSLDIQFVTVNESQAVCGMAHNLCDSIFDINCPDNIIE